MRRRGVCVVSGELWSGRRRRVGSVRGVQCRFFERQRRRAFAIGSPRLRAAGPAHVRVLLGPELVVVGTNVVASVTVVVNAGAVGGVGRVAGSVGGAAARAVGRVCVASFHAAVFVSPVWRLGRRVDAQVPIGGLGRVRVELPGSQRMVRGSLVDHGRDPLR